MLFEPGIRKAVVIGVFIAILGQFMGVNAVLYYGPTIFENAGLSSGDSLFSQVLVGVVNMLTSVLALVIIDRVGRKQLVYWGVSGMIVSLLCIGFYFMCGAALGLPSVFLLVFFLAYIFCCAVSICAVVWVLLSEMYPTRVRGLAMSIAGLALWVGTYLIGQLTPWMLENLTPAGTFFLFAAMCVPYMLIIWRAVPETTGRSLEEIEKYWQKMNNTNNESGAVRIQAGDLRRLDHLRDINLTTDTMDFQKLAGEYKSELLDSVLPFWLEHSQDKQYGGYFTCLERDGSVYDTDKFIWLQGREVWLFSMLYNKVEKRPEWLECALQGAEFLKKYGHDGNYNWYFSLTRDGRPLVDPYNIFSYTFATMAFAQLAIASDDAGYAAIAKKTFDRVLEKRSNPKGKWCKAHPGTRPIKDFALPMILCNLSLEIEQLIDKQLIDQTIETCLHEVMEVFYQKDLGLIVENVSAEDNSLVDSFEGRSVNPGHSLEAMWFIMDLGKRLGRPELIDKAVKIALSTIEYGWDKQYGGIFYFMDRLGRPQQQLEWDQKLWWVHIESAITMIKGYQLTGNKECLAWFQKLHDYMWTHFKDPKYPEWFGYLNRRGEVLLPLKGGKWKGCFHVPRGLYQIWQILEQCK